MRKAGRTLAVLALVLGLAALCSAQPTRILTILHTNDTHSAMLPFSHQPYPAPFTGWLADHLVSWLEDLRTPPGFNNDYAGIARMATLIKRIRMTRRSVLALDAGDVFVGSFEFNEYLGYPDLKIMEKLYDAMELGNHEFDLGLGTLQMVVGGQLAQGPAVTLPLLNANFNLPSGLVQKNIIKTVDGVKVGIFGLLNEDPVNYDSDTIALFSGDVKGVAAAQVGELKGRGCQVIICLSHLGTSGDMDLADHVEGIDIIVGGHSHELFRKAVIRNGTIIVQAGSHGRYLGELQVTVGAGRVKFLRWQIHDVDHTIPPDPAVQAQLSLLKAGILRDPRFSAFGDVYADRVATAVRNIDHDPPTFGPFRDAPLGDLVTDAMKQALQSATGIPPVDCVLDPLGYTEFGIPAGKIVGNDIMRAVPYGFDPGSGLGFKVIITALPPDAILAALEYTLTAQLGIQTSGLTFAYNSSLPPSPGFGQISQLDPTSVKINGVPILSGGREFYFIGMSDQVFGFLNALAGGKLPKYEPNPPIFEYAAVRSYIQSLGIINYRSSGRIIDTAATPAAVRRH